MAKTMTPSGTITKGQIGKIEENLGAALRKSDLLSEPTQRVLETQGDKLTAELVAVVRRYVESVSNMIVRHVKVDRNRIPQQVVDDTGRVQYTDKSVVATMPRGEGEEVNVFFFKASRDLSDSDLEKELDLHGLKPDPCTQAQVNADDPAFADDHPNGTHWKDGGDRWCFAAFGRSVVERSVFVLHSDRGWDDSWWFGGVRK